MAESWITLVDQDVFGSNAKERQSIVAIKGLDDLGEIVAAVTEQVRDAYHSGGRPLGAEGTIPANLKGRAIAIALWRFVSEGVPKNEGVQTKQREAAYTEATDYLTQIATRKITGGGSAQIVSQKTRQATRDTLSGL